MGNYKYFTDLLSNIEPSKTTKSYVSSIQKNLREYLNRHEKYKSKHLDTFISGSYAKQTSIRPTLNEEKQDVDIVVVTNYKKDTPPIQILNELKEVLSNNSKYKKVRLQSKSVGVEMANYHIDVVPVIIEDNQFYIGDSEKDAWILTNPKEHISWSAKTNLKNEDKFKPLVKIFKWWRKQRKTENLKLPKGILLEKIIADNIGDPKYDIENLLVTTMNNIIANYQAEYIDKGLIPSVYDPALQENDLLKEYTLADFSKFLEIIQQDLVTLKNNQFSIESWNQVLRSSPSKSLEEIQEDYSLSIKIEMDKILDQVIDKSIRLSTEIKEYTNKKIEVEKRERSIQEKEDEVKYNIYIGFLQDAHRSLSDTIIKGLGREYWLNIIKTLNSINEKRNRVFQGYEHSYLATIYKALELDLEYYNSLCSMVEDNFFLSIYEVKYVIENTFYRTTLKEALKVSIKEGDYSDTMESFREALKLLEENS